MDKHFNRQVYETL